MQRKAIEPNDTTYSAAISACEKGQQAEALAISGPDWAMLRIFRQLRLILLTRLLSYLPGLKYVAQCLAAPLKGVFRWGSALLAMATYMCSVLCMNLLAMNLLPLACDHIEVQASNREQQVIVPVAKRDVKGAPGQEEYRSEMPLPHAEAERHP